MSVAGYFTKIQPAVRMPKSDGYSLDALGLRWSGRMLTGQLSGLEAMRFASLMLPWSPTGLGPAGEIDAVMVEHMKRGVQSGL